MLSRNDTSPASRAAIPSQRSQTRPDPAPALDPSDRLAAWALRGPLACTLGVLCVFQLATWVPHYLTWPFWADHDSFATLARGWDLGRLPYRDLRCNNFPGTIYIHWVLGKAVGWGKTTPFFAVDAGLVISLGIAVLAWSRRKLGGTLPGLVGYLAFLSYYLGLDYCHVAQRDWHGPFFALLGLLVAQGWPGLAPRILSAMAMAMAVCVRPQTVLFLPAVALAIDESARRPGERLSNSLRALGQWAGAFAVSVVLAFLPILAAGLAADLVRGVRLTAYGGHYNRVTPVTVASGWVAQVAPLRIALLPAALALLARPGDPSGRRTALTWVVALGAVSLYKPLSPLAHSYLDIPLALVWSISLAVLVRLVASALRAAPSLQLVAILLALALGTTARPAFCMLGPTVRAVSAFHHGVRPEETPPGYRHGTVPGSAFYPWEDYRAALEYLRRNTGPRTLVANALKGDPALTAPIDRGPPFPAEAVAWLRMVKPDDEDDFARGLEASPDSVVAWVPGEIGPDPKFTMDRLTPVIRRLYRPEARFGVIEVWRRKSE